MAMVHLYVRNTVSSQCALHAGDDGGRIGLRSRNSSGFVARPDALLTNKRRRLYPVSCILYPDDAGPVTMGWCLRERLSTSLLELRKATRLTSSPIAASPAVFAVDWRSYPRGLLAVDHSFRV